MMRYREYLHYYDPVECVESPDLINSNVRSENGWMQIFRNRNPDIRGVLQPVVFDDGCVIYRVYSSGDQEVVAEYLCV